MNSPDVERIIDDALARIVATAHPRSVILFGSAVRGEMGPDSDVDLLVVVPSGQHRRKTAQSIYRSLVGLGFAADIVVVTEDDVLRYRDVPGLVIRPAMDEGRVIYAA